MKTALQTGPGFFAGESTKNNTKVPKGKMWLYCARIETYEVDNLSPQDLETQFELLMAKCLRTPGLANILLILGKCIEANQEYLLEQKAEDEAA